ncbi:TraB/GumN family protein [Isachenkonia alkalipeptolytica]|uniref:TraB/GumN family protein n=1 Tax=Isachenkonia alkalipeptolytica TaxID=2565777 RepID=A0AA43XJT8_9CLOT|nr:TraB/GumN family protein [Isachenkonia alkalipeptolytica]NBG88225.1 TraB/GumN family protein [Isachenkonia alkalipeptolytica]
MKKICLAILVGAMLLISGCSEGTEGSGNDEGSYEGDSRGLLYEGTINGATVYLYGGMSVLTEEHHSLATGVLEAFDQAEVYGESFDFPLSRREQEELQEAVMKYAPDEDGLREVLSEDVFQQVRDIAVEQGGSWQYLSRFKPWSVRNLIEYTGYQNSSLSSDQGTMDYFKQRTTEEDMETRALYNYEELILFHNEHSNLIPIESQKQMLKDTLEEIEAGNPGKTELIRAWEQGDTQALEAMLDTKLNHEDSGVQDYYHREYKGHNQEFAKRIEALILEEEKESYFLQFPVLNMVGADSLIEELEKAGYDFTPVEL